jgi:hypothetical protein
MKISNETIAEMRSKIEEKDTEEIRDIYRTGQYPRAERTKDVDMRYRWDLLHACFRSSWVCDLYDSQDVNDTHIDTALRSIVPPL